MQHKKLFSEKILAKNFDLDRPIGDVEREHLANWASAEVQSLKEITNHGPFQHIILRLLGYREAADSPESWTAYPEFAIGNKRVDIGLGFFSKNSTRMLVPVELKGKNADLDLCMSGRNKSPVEQAWDYAIESGAKWVIVSNYREIRLYSYEKGKSMYESFNLLTMHQDAKEYNKFVNLFSAENLLGELTSSILLESDKADKDITDSLYKEYSFLRSELIRFLLEQKKFKFTNHSCAIRLAQKLIDRILFIAFAEDKSLLPSKTIEKAFNHLDPYNPKPIWENFKGLFRAIDKGSAHFEIATGFNGGLFKEDSVLDLLDIPDEICLMFKKLSEYDFNTDINVNILGHIFEQSINDLETIRQEIDKFNSTTKNRRARDGVFYTPDFITRFMVEKTLGTWLADRRKDLGFEKLPVLNEEDYGRKLKTKKQKYYKNIQLHIDFWLKYRDCLSKVKICDPACGSGAFLNQAFDYLYCEGQRVNRELQRLRGGEGDLLRWDTHIIKNNLYGVDINPESVELTKLSLWLKTARKNEKLTTLDSNIKVGNSIISDKSIDESAFVWNAGFPTITENGGFDIIIENPPYIDSETMTQKSPQQRRWIADNYKTTTGNWDIYIPFIEKSFELLNPSGMLASITPDKWLSKDFGNSLRKIFLDNFISFTTLGSNVFNDAIVDAVVTVAK